MTRPDVDVAIIGAGFSGLGMAIRLKRRGGRSFAVLEKASALGGTWRDNCYPGCACDIQSNLYSFSFAPNPDWSRLYPTQPEIWAYLEACADRFGVREHIRFNARLVRAAWDGPARVWRCECADGRKLAARALVSGMGGLHIPRLPDIAGREAFAGRSWHSAAWRDDVALAGKRVAVIGTGASAIQIAPAIAPVVAKLDLYQRTPPWIVPKHDRPVSAPERRWFRRAPALQELKRRFLYVQNEARAPYFLNPGPSGGPVERFARAHLARQVADPDLRAKLTPDYRVGCKRVLISDDFYPALQRGNVELIASGARALGENAVIDGAGVARGADIVVFATGFKPFDVITEAEIIGAGGRRLNDEWKDGPRGYLGTVASGYPNFFTLMGPNSGLGHNSMIYMIESQIAFVLDALDQLDARGSPGLDVRATVEHAFNADVQQRLERSVWGSGCASWYLSPDGKNRALWPNYSFRYRARTRRVRAADFVFLDAA